MLPSIDLLRSKFDQALAYEDFIALGEPHGHRPQWDQRLEQTALTPEQSALVSGFTRTMNILCLTGTWCGDSALQGAAMRSVQLTNPERINLRFVMKNDDHADLIVKSQINQGFRVPVTFFLSEDMEIVDSFGDRTLSRYRSMARKDPRASNHVLAPAPENPVLAVRDEVVDLFERVHLILRLSGRLRQKHGD